MDEAEREIPLESWKDDTFDSGIYEQIGEDLLNGGHTFGAAKNFDEALKSAGDALSRAQLRCARARLLEKTDRFWGAVQEYERALQELDGRKLDSDGSALVRSANAQIYQLTKMLERMRDEAWPAPQGGVMTQSLGAGDDSYQQGEAAADDIIDTVDPPNR